MFKFLAPLFDNRIIYGIDEAVRQFCVQKVTKVGHDDWNITYRSRAHQILLDYYSATRSFLNIVTNVTTLRKLATAQYLAIAFEEKELDKAIQILASDLNKLDKEMPIMGNLAKFVMMTLSNTVGSGGRVLVIASFPICKPDKYALLGSQDLTKILTEKGIYSYCREGGVKMLDDKTPYSQLVISSTFIEAPKVGFIDSSLPKDSALPAKDDGKNE
jgi:hypothetical protein